MTNEEAKAFLDNLKICINEHPVVADWLVEIADRKTGPTISKMEQVGDEPQTPYDNCQSCLHWVYDGYWYCECNECHYEPKDEPQTDCAWK